MKKHVLNWGKGRVLRKAHGLALLFFLLVGVFLALGCQKESPVGDPQRVATWLVILLQDPSSDVRRTAALSLGKIGYPPATTALVQALADPDPQVREYSAWALGQLGENVNDKTAVRLVGVLADEHRSVRKAAAQALGKIGPRHSVLAILTEVLAAGERGSRQAAVEALAQLEAGSVYLALQNALSDPVPTIRQGAVAALGELADRRTLFDFRQRLLFDSNIGVRTEAAYRLGKLGDPQELQLLDWVVQNDASPIVRLWAKWARANMTDG